MFRWAAPFLLLLGCETIDPIYDDSENRACDPRTTWYADSDADGFGNAASVYLGCDQPAGFVPDNTDCDDADAARAADCADDTGQSDTGDTAGDTSTDTSSDTSTDSGTDAAEDSGDSGTDTSGDTSDSGA